MRSNGFLEGVMKTVPYQIPGDRGHRRRGLMTIECGFYLRPVCRNVSDLSPRFSRNERGHHFQSRFRIERHESEVRRRFPLLFGAGPRGRSDVAPNAPIDGKCRISLGGQGVRIGIQIRVGYRVRGLSGIADDRRRRREKQDEIRNVPQRIERVHEILRTPSLRKERIFYGFGILSDENPVMNDSGRMDQSANPVFPRYLRQRSRNRGRVRHVASFVGYRTLRPERTNKRFYGFRRFFTPSHEENPLRPHFH